MGIVTRSRLKEKMRPFVRRFRGAAQINRIGIIYILAHGPRPVHDLVDMVGEPENLISHHLKQLYTAGWVLRTRQGRTVTYRLNEKAYFEIERLFEDTPFWKEIHKK